jgi:pyrimidine oxygenase
VQKAERFGFDFALSMIKLHGFGGPSQFWDYNLESFTLMAGLAAVTSRIQLFATCAVLTLPPPIAARMAVTVDSISHGRFGVNIISGWQRREYTQMGVWPGSEHYRRRYDYCAEYVTIMQELWQTGRSDFQGDFFQNGRLPLSAAADGQDTDHLRRPKRCRDAVCGAICRLQFLWGRRGQPADPRRAERRTPG